MTDQTPQNRFRFQSRAVLWGLIVVYTLLIPNAIYVYRFIEARFGLVFAGKIPLVIVSVLGIGYVAYLWRTRLGWKKALYLIPCAVIALAIFRLEGNPNKHIHIPEYILMAWLVYAALKKDYRGGGMLILVFLLASMLGVVDELEQGIHPGRTYGWTDMLVNTSSALMGVFTILGLTDYHADSWEWTDRLKKQKALIGLILFGAVGAVMMCVKLFEVQSAGGTIREVYPVWLVVWNVSYTLLAAGLYARSRKQHNYPVDDQIEVDSLKSARLWVWPVVIILIYMHVLITVDYFSGITFK
ncbi:MAG: VanZ family protein [Chloroflexi bacterium]|nr:VanZ family protein [Chloroflexota bacterium]